MSAPLLAGAGLPQQELVGDSRRRSTGTIPLRRSSVGHGKAAREDRLGEARRYCSLRGALLGCLGVFVLLGLIVTIAPYWESPFDNRHHRKRPRHKPTPRHHDDHFAELSPADLEKFDASGPPARAVPPLAAGTPPPVVTTAATDPGPAERAQSAPTLGGAHPVLSSHPASQIAPALVPLDHSTHHIIALLRDENDGRNRLPDDDAPPRYNTAVMHYLTGTTHNPSDDSPTTWQLVSGVLRGSKGGNGGASDDLEQVKSRLDHMCQLWGMLGPTGALTCPVDRCSWLYGTDESACMAQAPECEFDESEYPQCVSARRLHDLPEGTICANRLPFGPYPLDVPKAVASDRAPAGGRGAPLQPVWADRGRGTDAFKLFFTYHHGVHLAEGPYAKFMLYNLDIEECAEACLHPDAHVMSLQEDNSEESDGPSIRCLSFDFYEFETSLEVGHLVERRKPHTGVCVLNSANSATARLRPEDRGLTDAELFYETTLLQRNPNLLSGYAELRDHRHGTLHVAHKGTEFSELMSLDEPTFLASVPAVWGRSRWGAHFLSWPSLDYRQVTDLMCEPEAAEGSTKARERGNPWASRSQAPAHQSVRAAVPHPWVFHYWVRAPRGRAELPRHGDVRRRRTALHASRWASLH